MSTFLEEPCRKSHVKGKSGNDVREIFYNKWAPMRTDLLRTIEKIEKWRDENIEEIKNYANEQINIFNKDCNQLRIIFDRKRREKLDQYDQISKQNEVTEKFYEECRAIQFQMAQLEHNLTKTIQLCNVMTAYGQQSEINLTENNNRVSTPTNGIGNQSAVPSDLRLDKPSDSGQLNSSSSSQRIVSAVKKPPLPPIRPSTGTNQSTKEINQTSIPQNHLDDPCPLCFMVFPKKLSQNDRQIHMNQHYVDDYEPQSANF